MKLFLVGRSIVAVCISILPVFAQVKREFVHGRDVDTPSTWRSIPHWENGLLINVDANHTSGPVVFTIDRDGRRDEFLFTLPDSGRIDIFGWALSQKGEVALGGAIYSKDSRLSTFIAWIDPTRTQQTVIRTWPLRPAAVTFSPDGTVWAIGNLTEGDDSIPRKHVLKRFDINGKVLSTKVIKVADPHATADITFLRGGKDRVGWFTGPEYLEFGLDGAEISRYNVPGLSRADDATGFALSQEGDVVVSLRNGGRENRFLQLDRQHGTWAEVPLHKRDGGTSALVLGFDGPTLVTDTANGRISFFDTK